MDLIYTIGGVEAGIIQDGKLDIEISAEKSDFSLTVPAEHVDLLGEFVYLEGTEFGGKVTGRKVTGDKVELTGKTFRGMLDDKVIMPSKGQDYYIINGNLSNSITKLLRDCQSGEFQLLECVDKDINFTFDRFTTLGAGLHKLCKANGLRMDFFKTETGIGMKILEGVSTSEEELSKDAGIDITLKQSLDYPNSMVALGKGELQAREVLFLDYNGSEIVKTSSPNWQGRRVYVYENTSSENLLDDSIKKFKELVDGSRFDGDPVNEVSVNAVKLALNLGDRISSYEPHTGTAIEVVVDSLIVQKENEEEPTISYKVKGGI